MVTKEAISVQLTLWTFSGVSSTSEEKPMRHANTTFLDSQASGGHGVISLSKVREGNVQTQRCLDDDDKGAENAGKRLSSCFGGNVKRQT